MTPAPLVFVTVGTDHHRFDRLMDWVERLLARPGAAPVRCVVQHGTSRAPTGAQTHELLPHAQVLDLMRQATLVVTQGGPGGIMDSRRCGRKPVVVPRTAALKEHVDDHQLAFTARMHDAGLICRVDTEEALERVWDAGVADPTPLRLTPAAGEVAEVVGRFGALVEGLVRGRSGRGRNG